MRKVIRIRCIIIVVLFALLATVGVIALFANADAFALSALSNGSGTKDDPYVITTMTQLNNLQAISASELSEEYTKDKYFRLDRDLATAYTVTSAQNGFFGHFDGNGHTIRILGDTGLFYRLASGGDIYNLNLNLNMKVDYAEDYYGLVCEVEEGAVIRDCSIYGNVTIDFSSWKTRLSREGESARFAAFCITNNGTISNCHYYGSVIQPNFETMGSKSSVRAGLYSVYGAGVIDNCTVEGNLQLVANSYVYYFSTFSRANTVRNCEFVGDVQVSLCDDYYNVGSVVQIYTIGNNATDSVHTGNAIFDHRSQAVRGFAKLTIAIGSKDGNCVHNGTIETINKAK